MNPGMTVMPPASIACALPESDGPAETETMRPSSTETEPFSIAPPLPSMILALVITRSWPQTGLQNSKVR